MKRFSCCLNLRNLGFSIAALDILLSLTVLILCSYYLYRDYFNLTNWAVASYENVKIIDPLSNMLSSVVDYVLLHNFPDAFYVVMSIILWIKSLINFILASLLIDGIRKKRTICIAPWLINTIISVLVEVTTYIFMEMKYNEIDAATDKRIVRSILFGIFIMFNIMFTFAIYWLCKFLKLQRQENQVLQDSIVEASGIFQHVKV
ncbi:hypothetical protein FF38_13118 [Lucilia cuprina]|uniref:Uncharacterized protein n=1 Tax=Lucilia cuprina TaxID=7375 RepID=A0A0L0CMA4_LUCCU|nr:hypothetical protein CVS40_1407 [Lucilia cuprina]KNC32599.1 hypothetical protein FF38_13118 [Lucilia cuprina]